MKTDYRLLTLIISTILSQRVSNAQESIVVDDQHKTWVAITNFYDPSHNTDCKGFYQAAKDLENLVFSSDIVELTDDYCS